jgi:hypothetical protein
MPASKRLARSGARSAANRLLTPVQGWFAAACLAIAAIGGLIGLGGLFAMARINGLGERSLPARTVGAAEKRQGWECGADGRRGGQPLPGQADRLAAQVRRFRLDADPSQARTPWAQPLPPAGPLLPALPAP